MPEMPELEIDTTPIQLNEVEAEQPIEEPAGDDIATADAAQGGDEALGRARR